MIRCGRRALLVVLLASCTSRPANPGDESPGGISGPGGARGGIGGAMASAGGGGTSSPGAGHDGPSSGGARGATGGSGSDDAAAGDDGAIDVGMPDGSPAAPGACAQRLGGSGPPSAWVSWGADGKLVYKPLDPHGDRIMDFSFAGYHGGGVALPDVPVKEHVAPSGGDDTAAIQGALDRVSQAPLVGGFRGAVLLGPGTFKSATTVTIHASGVVLRGSGSGAGGTEIQLTGANHRFLIVQGMGKRTVDAASQTAVVDDYVPSGTNQFTVASAAAFKVGDTVLVGRPVTADWVAFMGMDKLVRNGKPETWLGPGTVTNAERVITAITGNRITIDVPLSDSMDGAHVKPPGGTLTKYAFDRISEIGVEHMRVVGQPRSATVDFYFVALDTVVDSWVKDVVAHDVTAGVVTDHDAKRITIEDTTISHTMVDYVSAAKPSDFNIAGSQVLIQRSASVGSNRSFSMVTESQMIGPTVVLNFTVSGISPPLQPHQRWATGLLVDNANLQTGTIDFIDRNILGSGHGWTIGWAVAWNSTAPSFHIEQPPGTMNWAIGCRGTQGAPAPGHQNGTYESLGTPVAIKSLYLAQLCERLGPAALTAIGYE